MDYRLRQRTLLRISVNMAHYIVTDYALTLYRHIIVYIVLILFHLSNLLIGRQSGIGSLVHRTVSDGQPHEHYGSAQKNFT